MRTLKAISCLLLGSSGCFGIVWLGVFIAGLAGAFGEFATSQEHIGTTFAVATMLCGMVFLAVTVLGIKDYFENRDEIIARNRIWRALLAREDTSDEVFCREFPKCDPTLLLVIREALSRTLDVPTTKIRADDQLLSDYGIEVAQSAECDWLVQHVLALRRVERRPFQIEPSTKSNLRDFVPEIQRIVTEIEGKPH